MIYRPLAKPHVQEDCGTPAAFRDPHHAQARGPVFSLREGHFLLSAFRVLFGFWRLG